ncbi:U8-theraphotoxin-Hhn1c 2-like [Parasteatoda tepidariorum]|uniref:U8-theraphotoxin-Hhn1c 2-like n=1 Tax=Parasteatoda tepidariorum TaxID=114398 RepID=UPI0039BD3C5D
MKFLGLILLSSLAFFWTADAGCSSNRQCNDDECCITSTEEGKCRKLGTEGDICESGQSNVYHCPCAKGYICTHTRRNQDFFKIANALGERGVSIL